MLISNTALGSYRYCRGLDFNIDKCNLSKMENKQLTSIIIKLNSLHRKKFNKVFVICWDIMLDCKNKNNVKNVYKTTPLRNNDNEDTISSDIFM